VEYQVCDDIRDDPMPTKLILSVGMPRAGSGWYYNLTHDLIVAAGFQNAREIRTRYHLESILTEVNCNIGALTPHRLFFVLVPVSLGNIYVIKTHSALTGLTRFLIHREVIKPLYIYRDPRDALLSAYEYGKRSRRSNKTGVFTQLLTIEDAIAFMNEYVDISKKWLACREALHTRYEDLLLDYDNEVGRLIQYLNLDSGNVLLREVIENYRPGGVKSGQRGTHLVKGKIGRYRDKLTLEEQALCLQAFQPYLDEMGYTY
jgi:hypothetical protein